MAEEYLSKTPKDIYGELSKNLHGLREKKRIEIIRAWCEKNAEQILQDTGVLTNNH